MNLLDAARDGNFLLVSILLENKTDPNIQNEYGDSALHYAVYNHCICKRKLNYDLAEDYMNIIKLLLDKGADINIIDNYNYTPHRWAAMLGCSIFKNMPNPIAEFLRDRGAYVEMPNLRVKPNSLERIQ